MIWLVPQVSTAISAALITLAATAFAALCGLAGTVTASWISKRATRQAEQRASDLQERTVDREEFDSITRELRQMLDDLRTEVAREHDARVRAEQRAETADNRAARAAARAVELERRVSQLEEVLRAHDMPVPPSLGATS